MGSGIINGGVFGFVVKSLVDNIIIPAIAGLFKQPDFSRLYYALAAVAPRGGLENAPRRGPAGDQGV